MEGGCSFCSILFLMILTAAVGLLLGVYLSDAYSIQGLPDLWAKFVGLFGKRD